MSDHYIGYFPQCWDEIPDESNLRKEEKVSFWLKDSRIQPVIVGKSRQPEFAAAGHTASIVRKQRKR